MARYSDVISVSARSGEVIGCFKDSATRDMDQFHVNLDSMTNELCIEMCGEKVGKKEIV